MFMFVQYAISIMYVVSITELGFKNKQATPLLIWAGIESFIQSTDRWNHLITVNTYYSNFLFTFTNLPHV